MYVESPQVDELKLEDVLQSKIWVDEVSAAGPGFVTVALVHFNGRTIMSICCSSFHITWFVTLTLDI